MPLDDRFDAAVPEASRWNVEMVRQAFPNLGLVIDLTKARSGRFYDTAEFGDIQVDKLDYIQDMLDRIEIIKTIEQYL